ncbi:exosortase/archaeosortase family protein [Aquabacterium sp.]|jgi:exosortase/archaeosortase family protein|uniref:exosortase/archaeosortase family protein n=1 Tax=Aquabacterium sp. TaxID=1872578 RepID=UPI0025BA9CF9|nr:exosortase/archaeosortase family protein [Aquabacterium sp.]
MTDEALSQAQPPRAPIWRVALVFLLALAALQGGWSALRGSAAERAVIDQATVGTAVALVNRLTPEVAAQAKGSRIQAAGGGINVLNGCEGTEVLFLLWAALLAAPLSWRWRLQGALLGALWVFALNQLRLLALFYSYRDDRPLFNLLHGLVAPGLLVAATLLFVAWVYRRHDASQRLAVPAGAGGFDAA